ASRNRRPDRAALPRAAHALQGLSDPGLGCEVMNEAQRPTVPQHEHPETPPRRQRRSAGCPGWQRPGRRGGRAGPPDGWWFPRRSIAAINRLLLLPLFPIFQPLLGVPVMFLLDSEDVRVHERARPPAFRREFISGLVHLKGKPQR